MMEKHAKNVRSVTVWHDTFEKPSNSRYSFKGAAHLIPHYLNLC